MCWRNNFKDPRSAVSALASSRASPLPQGSSVFIQFLYHPRPCGSGLARDGRDSIVMLYSANSRNAFSFKMPRSITGTHISLADSSH